MNCVLLEIQIKRVNTKAFKTGMSTEFVYVVEGQKFVPLRPYSHWNYIDEVRIEKFPLLKAE